MEGADDEGTDVASSSETIVLLSQLASAISNLVPRLKHSGNEAKILPIILASFSIPTAAYYSQNYSGIIGVCLLSVEYVVGHSSLLLTTQHSTLTDNQAERVRQLEAVKCT